MRAHPAPVAEQPLDEFSNCHGGILHKLDELDTLPALLAPATEARRIASESLTFFDSVVYEHHAEEERELFPPASSTCTCTAAAVPTPWMPATPSPASPRCTPAMAPPACWPPR
jgi:hypothetical protein